VPATAQDLIMNQSSQWGECDWEWQAMNAKDGLREVPGSLITTYSHRNLVPWDLHYPFQVWCCRDLITFH
jgi:hypothetical protein